MARDRKWVEQIIAALIKGGESQPQLTAESIVDVLIEEGVLHLGYGDADIDIITDTFKEVYGTTKTSQGDRFAARRLADKYGSQAIVGIMRLLAQHSQEQYAPVVNSVTQLETKLSSVLSFLRKTHAESVDETIQTP